MTIKFLLDNIITQTFTKIIEQLRNFYRKEFKKTQCFERIENSSLD